MIGVEINACFKILNASRHFPSKINSTSFIKRPVRGFVILEKSLIKRW